MGEPLGWKGILTVIVVGGCGTAGRPAEMGPAGVQGAASSGVRVGAVSAVARIPVPAGATTIEVDFTGRGFRPWFSFQAQPRGLAAPLEQVLSEEGPERTVVAGTRMVAPAAFGPLRGQLVTAESIDQFCRPHFARAEHPAPETVLSIFACSEDAGGDAAVREGLAGFDIDVSHAPAVPAGTRRVAIGSYSMVVPEGLLLTFATAVSEAEESMMVKLVQGPCLTAGSETWEDEFRVYSLSQWKVTTRTTQHGGRAVLWAELDERVSANASTRIVHKACHQGADGSSLQIELSSSSTGGLTVRFEELVSAALELGLPGGR